MVDDCVNGERTGTPTRLCRISNASSRPSRAQIQSLLATERREERTRHGSARSQHQTRRPKFRLHRASSARPFERVAGTASCGHHLCCCVSCCLLAVQCTPAQSIGVRGNKGPSLSLLDASRRRVRVVGRDALTAASAFLSTRQKVRLTHCSQRMGVCGISAYE